MFVYELAHVLVFLSTLPDPRYTNNNKQHNLSTTTSITTYHHRVNLPTLKYLITPVCRRPGHGVALSSKPPAVYNLRLYHFKEFHQSWNTAERHDTGPGRITFVRFFEKLVINIPCWSLNFVLCFLQ